MAIAVTGYFVSASDMKATKTAPRIITKISTSIGDHRSIAFEKIGLHSDWRLRKSFDYATHKGVFRSESALKQVWADMINAWDEQKFFWQRKHDNQPVMPTVDFSKKSVLWYGDRGGGASFVTMKKVLEFDDVIEAHLVLFHSDFGSSHLNLWTVPKTDKPVRFVETSEYEKRGP